MAPNAPLSPMSAIYSGGDDGPDVESALDVLAFILCPSQAFASSSDPDEIEAIDVLMAPAREEAARRWAGSQKQRELN